MISIQTDRSISHIGGSNGMRAGITIGEDRGKILAQNASLLLGSLTTLNAIKNEIMMGVVTSILSD